MTEADRIKDRLRKAETIEALKAVWDEEIDEIMGLDSTMKIQTINLKDWLKDDFLRQIANQGAG